MNRLWNPILKGWQTASRSVKYPLLGLAGTLSLWTIATVAQPAAAQLVPDATLGTQVVTPPGGLIRGIPSDRITGGFPNGINLFHSFTAFNVAAGRGVYFFNPVGVENILARVTGTTASAINGRLGVEGAANLYLFNPNGIVFGGTASLDVVGSFTASTGNGVQLGATGQFLVNATNTTTLLNVQPGALFLTALAGQTGNITASAPLTAGQGVSLAAVGGNLTWNLPGAVLTNTGSLSGQTVSLSGASVTNSGTITGTTIGITATGEIANSGTIGSLSTPSTTQTLNLTGGSITNTGTLSAQDIIRNSAGAFVAGTLRGNFNLGNYTGPSLSFTTQGSIQYGTVQIVDTVVEPTFNLTATGTGSSITANGNISRVGDGVLRVSLRADGNINLQNDRITAFSPAGTSSYSIIDLNSINGSVLLENAHLSVSAAAGSEAGDIFIRAGQRVRIANSQIEANGTFGSIFIGLDRSSTIPGGPLPTGTSLEIEKSSLTATTTTAGQPGSISINIPGSLTAPGRITIDNSLLRTASSGAAPGGSVNLTVGGVNSRIDLSASSVIDASISGTGAGGSGVTLQAVDGSVNLSGNSQITTATFATTPDGSAGPIDIFANRINLSSSSALNTSTSGVAAGGGVFLTTTAGGGTSLLPGNGSVTLDSNSLINASVQPGASGAGGFVDIETGTFSLTDGARVQSRTLGAGNAGGIQLSFSDTATITGRNAQSGLYSGLLVSSSATSTGSGGSITINSFDPTNPFYRVGDLTLSEGGFLSAGTANAQPGGNIDISVNTFSALSGGQVLATSTGLGQAGNITIEARGNVRIDGSRPDPGPIVSPFASTTLISLDGRPFSIPTAPGDPNVEESGTIPFISLQRNPTAASGRIVASTTSSGAGGVDVGAASPTVDYYQFTIPQDGSRAIFDIDNALSSGSSIVRDPELFLYDRLTGQLLAANDDFFPVDSGSTTGLDSRIAYNFNSAGTYVLGVGRFPTSAQSGQLVRGVDLVSGTSYRLQVSLQNRSLTPTPPTFNLSDRNPNQGLNSGLFSDVPVGGIANGGLINVFSETGNITVANFAEVNTDNAGAGFSGSVSLWAGGAINVTNNARVQTESISGSSGFIDLVASTVRVENGLVSASTETGLGGGIFVDATRSIELIGFLANGQRAGVLAESTRGGSAGNIFLNAPQLTVRNGGQATASSTGNGTAGFLDITAGVVSLQNNGLLAATNENDTVLGGLISLRDLSTLDVQNSLITASTRTGFAGFVSVTASQSVRLSGFLPGSLDRGGILATATAGGEAGFVDITTPSLTIENGAQAAVSSTFAGFAGDLTINAAAVSLNNNGRLAADTQDGSGGNITFQNLVSLRVNNGSEVSASTVNGQGGSLLIPSSTSIFVGNGGLLFAGATGTGTGGNLTLNTGSLTVTERGQIAANTVFGAGGSVEINAGEITVSERGQIAANTDFGIGGRVNLRVLGDLRVNTFGEISTSTIDGQAGTIDIQASRLFLDGNTSRPRDLEPRSGIRSIASRNGNAGNINLTIFDLFAAANGGEVRASSGGGQGGNIEINANKILLTTSSPIITSVSSANGNAGNITIRGIGDRAWFFALSDSDILATAASGQGGEITIDFPRERGYIFIAENFSPVGRSVRDANLLRGNNRVDISANSSFGSSGKVTIPDLSFLQNTLAPLANNLVSADRIVAGSCIARRNAEQGSFVVTGLGGLPRTPYDSVGGRYDLVGVRSVETTGAVNSSPVEPIAQAEPAAKAKVADWKPGDPIQEAQGMVTLPDGGTVLGTMGQITRIAFVNDLICNPATTSQVKNP